MQRESSESVDPPLWVRYASAILHTNSYEKGAKQEKVSNARNFKVLGVPYETISQATGLSIEEIEKL